MASTRPGPRLPDRALRRLLCPPFTHSRALIDRVPVDAAVMLMSTALRGETVAVPTGRSRDRPLYLRSATSTLILARLSPAPIWFVTHCQFDTAAYDPRLFEGSGVNDLHGGIGKGVRRERGGALLTALERPSSHLSPGRMCAPPGERMPSCC